MGGGFRTLDQEVGCHKELRAWRGEVLACKTRHHITTTPDLLSFR
eukprot:COSAG06_NODE_34599_length_472_cov_1.008043_1_plen_44_part_10